MIAAELKVGRSTIASWRHRYEDVVPPARKYVLATEHEESVMAKLARGPQTAHELACVLEPLTPQGIRRILKRLQAAGKVRVNGQVQGFGRPAAQWILLPEES